jgi:hypothetical protein
LIKKKRNNNNNNKKERGEGWEKAGKSNEYYTDLRKRIYKHKGMRLRKK